MPIIYVLQRLQGQLDDIHDFIFCLNSFRSCYSSISFDTKFQILGPKCLIDSIPYMTVYTL